MKRKYGIVVLFIFFISISPSFPRTGDTGQAAKTLVLRLHASAGNSLGEKNKIAVLPFAHLNGQYSEFSTYFASEIVTAMIRFSSFKPVERNRMDLLFREIAFNASGAVDNAAMARAGRMQGADALLIGDIAIIGEEITINARLVSVESAETVSSAKVTIRMNPDIKSMLERVIGIDSIGRDEGRKDRESGKKAAEDQLANPEIFDDFEISLVRCYRQSDRILIDLRVSNLQRRSRTIRINPEKSRMIDNQGETYTRPYIRFIESERNWGEVSGEVENGIPLAFRLTFKEIPEDVERLQLLQIGFHNDGVVKFRNVRVK